MQEFIDVCDYAVGLSRMLPGHVFPSESKTTAIHNYFFANEYFTGSSYFRCTIFDLLAQ